MSVWVACNGAAEEELPSTKQSEIIVDVCLDGIHWRWRSAASVAQAVLKRRGCLGGIRCSGSPRTSWVAVWVACNGAAEEELPSTKQSENVMEVCLGGMQWNCRRGTSVPQAV